MDVQTLVLVLHGFSIAVLGCDGLKALNNLLHQGGISTLTGLPQALLSLEGLRDLKEVMLRG